MTTLSCSWQERCIPIAYFCDVFATSKSARIVSVHVSLPTTSSIFLVHTVASDFEDVLMARNQYFFVSQSPIIAKKLWEQLTKYLSVHLSGKMENHRNFVITKRRLELMA